MKKEHKEISTASNKKWVLDCKVSGYILLSNNRCLLITFFLDLIVLVI
jgi:hypothetical protein